MDAIPGLDLGALTQEANTQYQEDLKAQIRIFINKEFQREALLQQSLEELKQQVIKIEERLAKQRDLLKAFSDGQWASLKMDEQGQG